MRIRFKYEPGMQIKKAIVMKLYGCSRSKRISDFEQEFDINAYVLVNHAATL